MYHHHPAWRKLGQHPAICQVVASLYGGTESVQMLSDGVWMKPAGGLGATLHQVRTTACARAPCWAVPRLSALSLLPLSCLCELLDLTAVGVVLHTSRPELLCP